jgi:small-conductance mechanosensitive channel
MKKITVFNAVLVLCILLSLTTISRVAYAQNENSVPDTVEVPQALGPEAMKALVSKLDEKQTAALAELIELLDSSAASNMAKSAIEQQDGLKIVKQWFTTFATNFRFHLESFPQVILGLGNAIGSIFQGREAGGNLIFLLLVAVVAGAGLAAEWLFNRVTASKRERIRQSHPNNLMDSFRILSTRAGIEIGGVIVFALTAIITNNLFVREANDQFLISAFILYTIVIPRIFGSIMHFVLAPRRPELRLVHVDSDSARYIERHFIIMAAFVGIALFLSIVMQKNEIAYIDTVRFWLGLGFHTWLIIITLKVRYGLTQIIEGGEENLTQGLKRIADWWPALSAAFIAFNWFFLQFVLSSGHQTLSPQRSAAAIMLIVLTPFLDTIVRSIAGQLVPADDDADEVVNNANNQTRHSYIRVGRILLLGLIMVIVGKLWGLSLTNLAEAGFGAQVAANIVGFLLIVTLGYFAWEMTNFSINKRLARELPEGGADGAGGAEGGTGLSRMATILPLLRMTLQATIIILTVLLALSQLGVNITPLLAGAGVLGLAIGFGAQTLVKDVVSGVFYLMDDAFRLGEFITVGTTNGIVQKISVRSFHLRQDTGPIHIIPYGSISQLTNNSRDYVTMKLRFTVPFDTDQEKVRKIFKKIGQEMMEVPELAEVLINPFKSQGAADVTDVGIVIRGKFTTVPGGQFLIRKEAYSRVQKAFEANGIEFARKEVRVHLPDQVNPSNLNEAQKSAISAAAEEASETPGPGPGGQR